MQRYFTKDHEWIAVEGEIGTVGITDHAQQQLGDVVYVELPKPDQAVTRGGNAAVVESVKAASEVYAPITGTITEINDALADNPALINQDAEGAAWFFKLRIGDPTELEDLLDQAAYTALLATLD